MYRRGDHQRRQCVRPLARHGDDPRKQGRPFWEETPENRTISDAIRSDVRRTSRGSAIRLGHLELREKQQRTIRTRRLKKVRAAGAK